MVKIVHCKKEKFDIYIGRKCYGFPDSKWKNPFRVGVDGTREEVIEKFRKYILENPDLLRDLHELEGKILGCWCSPLACHGDVLKELVEKKNDV